MHDVLDNAKVATPLLLIKPNVLLHALPQTGASIAALDIARTHTRNIIQGRDKRLLVIVGPCSIHDEDSALEYATRLKQQAERFSDELFLMMRVYFEKPRTTIGWKGFIRDPDLDGSYQVNEGLTRARKLLLALATLRMPAATEFLDNIVPHYLSDLLTWCAIGARTTASQLHREIASGLAMPVGFKNTVDGNVDIAIDAMTAARQPQHYLGLAQTGEPAVLQSLGNPFCHIILRGSDTATNYSHAHVNKAAQALRTANFIARVMIDCSHGNSLKNYRRQQAVIDSVVEQLQQESPAIFGVMLESHLKAGKQQLSKKNALVYGQSITDGCLGWDETVGLLEKLASGV